MAFWSSFGHHGAVGEFEWVGSTGEGGDADGFQVLREGHLSMSTSVPGEGEGGSGAKETADGNAGNAAAQSLRKRNEAFIKGWKRYWCVLLLTHEGQANLLYYAKQSSYSNCEAPTGVLLLTNWKKLYTLPQHAKSRYIFAVEFPYKTVQFITENDPDLEGWLVAFRVSLGVKEEAKDPVSPGVPEGLKGLPKQKAMRRVCTRSSSTSSFDTRDTAPQAAVPQVVPKSRPRSGVGNDTEIPSLEEEDGELRAAAKNVRILSYKVYPTPP